MKIWNKIVMGLLLVIPVSSCLGQNSSTEVKGNLEEVTAATFATADWIAYKKGFDSLAAKGDKAAMDQYRMNFIRSKPNSAATVYIVFASTGLSAAEKQAAYNRMSGVTRSSYLGKLLPKHIEWFKKYGPYINSGTIPDFKIRNVDGKPLSIMQEVVKSKYTLIDFWASWCGPCRTAFPHLKELYLKYRDQGFNVIGVSSDQDEAAWRKAMKEDGTPWVNGWDNVEKAGKNLFDIIGIPSLIIVDQKGKVVFSNMVSGSWNIVRGNPNQGEDDLDKKLTQLFNTK